MILVFLSLLLASFSSAAAFFSKRKFLLCIGVLFSLLSACLSFALTKYVNINTLSDVFNFKFFEIYSFLSLPNVAFGFRVDSLSTIWTITCCTLCFFTSVYSVFYMKKPAKFISYNNLFAASMIVFVSSNNWLQMYIGIELMSIMSYLLINFYHDQSENVSRIAFSTFLMNKFGDLCFLSAILLHVSYCNTFDFNSRLIYYKINESFTLNDVFMFLMIISASVKSAQFGFMRWLTNAMIAPTPASAFLHGATVVSAGVFLLARIGSIYMVKFFINSYLMFLFLAYFLISAIISAALSIKENDIKKILAYSTISKTSLMLFSCLAGNITIAVLFFVIHAFEKCLLFFCAGNISKALSNARDISKMGGLMNVLPKTYSLTLLSTSLYLGVIPLVADISGSFHHAVLFNVIFYLIDILSILCIIRVIYLIFHGESKIDDKTFAYLSDGRKSLTAITAACILANILLRIALWIYLPNDIFSLHAYLINFAIVALCAFIYSKYKFDHLIEFLNSFQPINVQLDFSSTKRAFRNMQCRLESFSFRLFYVYIIRCGRSVLSLTDSYNLCILIGSILVILFIINFSGGIKWLQMIF